MTRSDFLISPLKKNVRKEVFENFSMFEKAELIKTTLLTKLEEELDRAPQKLI
jgi:hypothetical protein